MTMENTPLLIGIISTITGPFSIAMLNYQRVTIKRISDSINRPADFHGLLQLLQTDAFTLLLLRKINRAVLAAVLVMGPNESQKKCYERHPSLEIGYSSDKIE